MKTLRDQKILITGASSGIGAELAREMARRGARVGLLARREDRLKELAEEIERIGARVAWAAADVTDAESLERGLDHLVRELGGVDIVVANAGTNQQEPPHRFEPGRALQLYDINLLGAIRLIDWALPRFLEQGSGQIVGVASVASYFGLPANAAYCAGKAALRIHLQSLRVSLKHSNIAVTTICPGFVKSELTDEFPGKMPFFWPTDRAARLMADVIEKRRAEVIFPWQMRWIVRIMTRLLPRALVERLVTPGPRRPR